MTIRLALVIYFSLWLAWLVSAYVRRYHGHPPGQAVQIAERKIGRRWMHLLIWSALVLGIAAAWRAMHPAG